MVTSHVRCTLLIVCTALLLSATGCVAFRSEILGRYDPSTASAKHSAGAPVRLLFVFRHQRMVHGLDTVPKMSASLGFGQSGELVVGPSNLGAFPSLVQNAVTEIRNLESFATFTETPQDDSSPERQELRKRLRSEANLILEMRFLEETRLVPQFLNGLVSILTLTIVPTFYDTTYSVKARVIHPSGAELYATTRSAELTDWVELLLVFVYPFHPRERKVEEIYVEFLRDVFRELDAKGILDPGGRLPG